MAWVKCGACGGQALSEVATCPHCGHSLSPARESSGKRAPSVLIVVALAAVALYLGYLVVVARIAGS